MKAKWKFGIRREIRVLVALAGIGALIGFSERKQNAIMVRNILVEMENVQENHFLEEADVLRLVVSSHAHIMGSNIDGLPLKAMENNLKKDAHILDAELFADLKGNLIAQVELRRPIARIVSDNAPDVYIADDGTIMSVSEKYTSRVLLVSGTFSSVLANAKNIHSVPVGAQLMEMIQFIGDDPFWKSQVAQLDINGKGEIVIFPQITGQRVEFGLAEEIETKFRKLKIFYKEILPQRGWTKYERVNLKYEGQVIAE